MICALLFLTLTIRQSTEATASPSVISGTYNVTLTNYAGTSQYTVEYSYPSTVNLGQNLTVTFTVIVNELTSLKLYLFDWGMQSILNSPDGQPINYEQSVAILGDWLYPGSHWGPINITIPISSANFSISEGSTYQTSVSLYWIADVQYDYPYSWHYYENQQTVVGNLTITNISKSSPTSSSTYSYLAIAGVGIVIVVVGIWAVSSRKKVRAGHATAQRSEMPASSS